MKYMFAKHTDMEEFKRVGKEYEALDLPASHCWWLGQEDSYWIDEFKRDSDLDAALAKQVRAVAQFVLQINAIQDKLGRPLYSIESATPLLKWITTFCVVRAIPIPFEEKVFEYGYDANSDCRYVIMHETTGLANYIRSLVFDIRPRSVNPDFVSGPKVDLRSE